MSCNCHGGDFGWINFILLAVVISFLILITSIIIEIQADTHVIRMECCLETQFDTQTARKKQ